MSEYKIVNRVHPTPAFAQTVAEVEAQVELDKSLPLVEQVLQNSGMLAELTKQNYEPSAAGVEAMLRKQSAEGHSCLDELRTAEASQAPSDVMVEVMALYEKCREESLPINRKEFEDFKERVIRAFKDMGFDTRKFFDE